VAIEKKMEDRNMLRLKVLLGVLGLLIVAGVSSIALGETGTAQAYGRADQPVAQIEFSGNCNTPTVGVCDAVGGTGGIWLWIELDADGTGDVAGAACGHTVGGGGAGAFPIRGDITWSTTTDTSAGEFFGLLDPNGQYYLVTVPQTGDVFVFPQTVGHYSQRFQPGFQLQLQIAP
jgi:hypothetical protein